MTKPKAWYLVYDIASFFLPFLIMFFVLLSMGISYGSERTILASDSFHQYVIFAQALRNILHGADSMFYTFTSGLGVNFFALASYYLGSLLSPLVYFFNLQSMPDAIYLLTLIKFGLIGLVAYFSFHRIYPKIKPFLVLTLSVSYSLMSFLTSQLELNNWLDVFILLPIVLLGLHRLITQTKPLLYYSSLSILFIQHYYFGYMVAIFVFLLFLVNLISLDTWKRRLRACLSFTSVSILSALTSAFILIPAYLDLAAYGETLSPINQIIIKPIGAFDLLAKLSLGAYDTTKFNAIPMIFIGLLPLLLSIVFFTLKSISWRLRLGYGLLLGLIMASFYLQPLDLFWQGMHAPNMFLHRYSWSFSIIIIILACEALSRQKDITNNRIVFAFILLSCLLTLPYLTMDQYSFLQPSLLILSLAFLVAYLILLLSMLKASVPMPFLIFFTLLFCCLETSLNTYYQLNGIHHEWVFPSRKGYSRALQDIDKLVKKAAANNDQFFRLEQLLPQTGNDSMKYSYNGISQFSSIRNRHSSSLLDRLGYQSAGTNLNLRYQNNTLIMDSLLGVKYNLSYHQLHKFGFSRIASSHHTTLYQNHYSSNLAILTDNIYKDVKLTVNTLDNQTKLLNQLSGKRLTYFQLEPSKLISNAQVFNGRISGEAAENTSTTIVHYQVTVPNHRQLYLSLPNISFSNHNATAVRIRIDDQTYEYTTDNAFSFFDLGYFEKRKTLTLAIIFPKNKSISFAIPHFYSLNSDNYLAAMNAINQKEVTAYTHSNQVISHYKAKSEGSMIFTLPYDKGWTARLNGRPVALKKAQGGFIRIDVPKGSGKLVLTFVPNGFTLGLLLSFIGILLYSFLHYYLLRQTAKLKA
ncbi:YfhO family protein [Streptococcus equi]|uniref:YfhO family protein n=1 Tax=Streptococcus equi TaxID=1336 RepID=UPI000DA3C6B5|nr:YfhO family protein [Streptococcus equi]MCD3390003.1 YfhO family protein [Streptococcus equi subsp. zooepidemicus]MCD3391969.1 YfhO family protein [Streptococcus equi subsp. zooepidemicus]SQF06528.1 membrane protein [Streptococcus equi subsp. zooepidemicus]HEL0619418.1 YfhO family protein [Streptococcus equi subsp. zooepidemicus]HEL0624992.1 YfhO family protein [Streptococcus equi subsp. zooepidemicus]